MKRSQAISKKTTLRLLVTLLLGIMILSYLPANATVDRAITYYDREEYFRELTDKGFSADYAAALSELMLAHPTWSFEPLLISELNSKYTFDYILKRQTLDPSTNLVYPSKEYSAFWDKSSGAVYDSGWYSANDAAVAYFLDPRNFLNETDIFQFEDVRYYERDYGAGVDGVLSGTFMDGMYLENSMTVRDYILQVGQALSVSPVHIAARLRQEQGTLGEGGTISGRVGELLSYFYQNKIKYENGVYVNTPSSGYSASSLLSYNGYYNFFNVGASGDGVFYIYLNAMKRAYKGTPEMSQKWGNNGAWDSMYKSIYGGVYSLKKNYVDDFQNTLYLQKFNIDPRSSRNFWGQYMQNVGAALSEGRSAYKSYKAAGVLESEFTFLIPVFENMQASPAQDPSAGASRYSPSSQPYTYLTHMDYPAKGTVKNGETRISTDVRIGSEIRIQGYSVHTYGTQYYEISVDGGAFEKISSYPRADVREKYAEQYPQSYDVNAYLHYIDSDKLEPGVHSIVVRAKTNTGSYYQAASISVNVYGQRYDMNGDGVLDLHDVAHLMRYIYGYDVELYYNGDVDGDGAVNNVDVIELLIKAANIK